MKLDLTNEDCTPTLRQILNAALLACGLAVCLIGPRDMEASEVTAQTMSEAVAVVRAAQQVAEAR